MRTWSVLGALAAGFMLAAACASSGAGGREVRITQRDDGCTPASIEAQAGEKLKLVVKNESGKDYEIEGIEGTKLEEVVVPKGKTRTPGYTVPGDGGTHKLKCYVPGGVSTIIEVVAAEGAGGGDGVEDGGAAQPDGAEDGSQSVAVSLRDYGIAADKTSVSAGKVRFIATNVSSTEVHELYVLRRKDDGSFTTVGEIEAIDPQKGGSMQLDVEPGAYELACLIVPGEAGSTVDHYARGMHIDFAVR